MKRTLVCFLWLAFLALPHPVHADGLMIPPLQYRVWETGQKAVIWFENGQETLILSTAFTGDAADFGWIIPVPSRPEVEKGSDEIFTSLQELTEPKYRIQDVSLKGDIGIMKAPTAGTVTVVETKKVDIYDVSVVTSTESEALAEWFRENDYPYPVSQAYILDEYLENDWYFVAAKIDTEKLGDVVQGQLKEGHATPLLIKFATKKIVYPLKISSITGDFFESDVIYREGFNQYSLGGWTTDGVNSSFIHDATEAYEGLGSAKLQAEKDGLSAIEAARILENLIRGKTYTFSVHLRIGQESSGSAYLNISQSGLETSSQPWILSNQWQGLTLTFTAQAQSHRFKIVGQGFSKGESFNIDAVQVELGSKATPFEAQEPSDVIKIPPFYEPSNLEERELLEKKISRISPSYMPPLPTKERIEILLYVFDPKKKVEIPGFAAEYAGWVRPKEIEKLAFDDQGNPLLPAKRKMYLTKLTRSMSQTEMTSDLYPRYAEKNRAVGQGSSIAIEPWMMVLIFAVPLLLEIGFITWLFSRRRKNK